MLWNQSTTTVATTLKKTATALISQVEKSLAPLPPTTGSSGTGYYAQGKSGELRARGKSGGGVASAKNKKA